MMENESVMGPSKGMIEERHKDFAREADSQPPLAVALDDLEQSLDRLNENISRLRNRLGPVTSARPFPCDTSPGEADESVSSSVVEDLKSKKEWVDRLSNDVNTLIYRLDV